MKYSDYLFWDIDLETFDEAEHSAWLMVRVFERGTLEDIRFLLKSYPKPQIKEALMSARHSDKITLAFADTVFEVEEKEFRCYKNRQSFQRHWEY